MIEIKDAPFKFENYRISKFSFSNPDNEDQKMNISFNPSGTFLKEEARFIVQFEFTTSGIEDGKQIISAKVLASFKFFDQVEFEEIPKYFYKNSIAIVFPYLRAFITTLTILAGVKPVILPILNLESLEKRLLDNIEIIKIELNDKPEKGTHKEE